ncbi:NlpC/P60 family protein [Catellatospora sichuanensis]|uniref:C40 family peptidase n=1 Tax=Catellatospora sichuanensis TaxID=1969805 RepID=UPI001181F48E|nr:NlpC/P60 family protein [Catellatospora sichuanensis]
MTAAVVLLALLAPAAQAHAAPTPAEIEKQIDEQWDKLEPVIEEHNATKLKLTKQRKKADELSAQLAPLELKVEVTRARIGALADQLYRGGTLAQVNAFLRSGDAGVMAKRLLVIDQLAHDKKERIADTLAAKSALDAVKQPLDETIAQLAKTEAEQAGRSKAIEAEIAKLNKLRLQAYANGNGIGKLAPVACPTAYPGGPAGKAVQFACRQIGKMYGWGDAGPSTFDCSGLTKAAWAQAGISLPHNARSQRANVKSVSRADLKPGDLVFYYSDLHHVGMYAGNGWIVHASQTGKPIAMRRMDAAPIHSFGRPA